MQKGGDGGGKLPHVDGPRLDKCDYCGGGLLHEIAVCTIEMVGGRRRLCVDCARDFFSRLQSANVEAGSLLESWWRGEDAWRGDAA